MTNFDHFKREKKFSKFVDVAITAERILSIDPTTSVIDCRRAMEFAIKWMYSVDSDLRQPYNDRLITLMTTEDFREIVDENLWRRLDFIRRSGNNAAHTGRKISRDQAALCLKNLYIFFDFIDYCYGDNYQEVKFDEKLLDQEPTMMVPQVSDQKIDLEKLIKENADLKKQLTERREEKRTEYVPKPLDLSEYKTRKIYIDSMLVDAGWTEGKNWINEFRLYGMPNASGVGFADYVLLDDTGIPLAVIEAKKTCVDISKGRQQAALYARLIEKQYKRRPVIFLTNGFETRIDDGIYPERKVAGFYSKRDLEKFFNLKVMKKPLTDIKTDDNIIDRWYQKHAVEAVCEAFDQKNRRKALLVMATGSGKTRTVVALTKVLLEKGWDKNILFLADRTALVTQAKRSFTNLLPNLSCTNLVEKNADLNARCIFSTYPTMMGCIDSKQDEQGKIFSIGHFDLIIVDEAHRSLYNKYKDIFTYFDAPVVGLTATPKDEIDKNTYDIFGLENGVPTFGYGLEEAVGDKYLVGYTTIETKLKFMEKGITYADLSKEDKEQYEETFADPEGKLPEKINSGALNKWLFNTDTIKKVLNILMIQGLKVNYGETLGKTIIFAANHRHAEKILEVFNKEYPELAKNDGGRPYAAVVDNYINYAQSLIDEFSDEDKMPRIAISVDMLDTGIDVPSCLNLVFFKKVFSKAKFWQMIGRGTRLCPGLIDGKDKTQFYIFDFCDNFEFFRMNDGKEAKAQTTLQSALFNLEFQIAYKLQDANYQVKPMIDYRKDLVDSLTGKVKKLNRDNFAVRQHLKCVDTYAHEVNYQSLTYEDCLEVGEEVAPLILPDGDEINALRFDALMLHIELCKLSDQPYGKAKSDLVKKAVALSKVANIPAVQEKLDLINQIQHTDVIDRAGVGDLESIRLALRNLIKFIPHNQVIYETNFDDEVLGTEKHEAEYDDSVLENYREKVEFYIKQHQQDNAAIAKLKSNKPLDSDDLKSLENTLWQDLGTKDDYQKEYGDQPIGEFIRSIVGLDMNAAKEAFSAYLSDTSLNSQQIYFLNQIVEYIAKNGLMKDLTVMQDSPFIDRGNIIELFGDRPDLWTGIRMTIQHINDNADVVA